MLKTCLVRLQPSLKTLGLHNLQKFVFSSQDLHAQCRSLCLGLQLCKYLLAEQAGDQHSLEHFPSFVTRNAKKQFDPNHQGCWQVFGTKFQAPSLSLESLASRSGGFHGLRQRAWKGSEGTPLHWHQGGISWLLQGKLGPASLHVLMYPLGGRCVGGGSSRLLEGKQDLLPMKMVETVVAGREAHRNSTR